jgi:gliding motility-associated-like protein
VLPPIQQELAAAICNGQSYTLGSSVFTQSGQYQEVFTASNGCDSTVSLNLTVLPPIQQAVAATICNGQSYTLGTSVFTQSGQYQEVLMATNGCDSIIDLNLLVLPPFVVNTQVEPLVCTGQTGEISVVVEGGIEPYQFSMDNGPFQSEDSFGGLQPGVYVIVVQDDMGCTSSVAATVEPAPALTLNFPEPQLTLESGDSIVLSPIANFTVDSFVWQPEEGLDCPQCWQPVARPARNITYQLTAYSAEGCEATASVQIKVVTIRRIYIPNVFNPNNDGFYDTFTLYSDEQVVKILRMSVFDRWGEEIFTARDFFPNELATGWDGRFRGKEMSPGVYVYLFEVLFTDGTTGQYSGDVTLVR